MLYVKCYYLYKSTMPSFKVQTGEGARPKSVAYSQQKDRTDTASPSISCKLSDIREIDFMLHFDYSNDADDSTETLMIADVNITNMDGTQKINMYAEFKPQDLVSHELLSVINIIADGFIVPNSNGEYGLLKALKELIVSHNFRGHTRDCIKARTCEGALRVIVYNVYRHIVTLPNSDSILYILAILAQDRHCIKVQLFPFITRDPVSQAKENHNAIIEFRSAMADSITSSSTKSFHNDDTVYEIISVYDSYDSNNMRIHTPDADLSFSLINGHRLDILLEVYERASEVPQGIKVMYETEEQIRQIRKRHMREGNIFKRLKDIKALSACKAPQTIPLYTPYELHNIRTVIEEDILNMQYFIVAKELLHARITIEDDIRDIKKFAFIFGNNNKHSLKALQSDTQKNKQIYNDIIAN